MAQNILKLLAYKFINDIGQGKVLCQSIMPEISRFLGIMIKMFLKDHNPPHFHAFYGGDEAVFSIETGQMIQGEFPVRKAALVTAWAIVHREELLDNWNNLSKGKEAKKIDPLR